MREDNRSQIVSGIILIGVGMIFLLETMGIISHLNWRMLLHFWPVILIFIGLNILFNRNRFWWLVPVLMVITIIGLVIVEQSPFSYEYRYRFDYTPEELSGIYRSSRELTPDIKELEININLGAGKIKVSGSKDVNQLYLANLRFDYYRPNVSYDYNQEIGKGLLQIEERSKRGWLNITRFRNAWDIYLTDRVPLDLKINVGAGDFNLDLNELQAENLQINAGAGKLEIDLNQTIRNVVLNSGAAEMDLNIPEGLGVEIRYTGVISSHDFLAEGLLKDNNVYRTKNFEKALHKVTIKINASASKIDLDFYRVNEA